MTVKEFIKDYLSFTRRERIAVLVLVTLIVLTFLGPQVIPGPAKRITDLDTNWISQLKKTSSNQPWKNDQPDSLNHSSYQYDPVLDGNHPTRTAELFYFDPNGITKNDWQRLGLREKTISTIENYRNKGGRFNHPADLKKIYGLRKSEYERLLPYIMIKVPGENKIVRDKKAEIPLTKITAPRYSSVDINSADTTAFIMLPGIGSKLAARIVNFREKLGGFHTVEQVGEIYGLADSTFQKLKKFLSVANTSVRKININTATVDELKTHPYIKWTLANPIVAYRNEHGSFTKTEDLKKIIVITEEVYQKLVPYLTL